MVAPVIAAVLRGAASMIGRAGASAAVRGAMGRIGVQVTMDGVEAVQQALQQVQKNLSAANVERVVQKWIDDDFVPTAQRIVPVDTGELRDSIDGEANGYVANCYAKAEHSTYVEEGTSKMKAQPYMRPAAKQTEPKLVRMIGKQAVLNIKTEGPQG